MWVYRETQESNALPLPLSVSVEDAPAAGLPAPDSETSGKTESTVISPEMILSAPGTEQSPRKPVQASRKLALPSRDCLLLAAAYLFGTFLAGLAAARCNAGEAEAFGYYLNCWQKLFSVNTATEAAGLFRTELLTLTGALTALLFLGLSALGPLPIFLFTILYGIGSGLLSLQWASGQSLPRLLVMAAVCGIPAALAAGAVCSFGASALGVSGRLCASTFGRSGQAPGAGTLLGQFARTLFLLLPLCGGAVAALYLAGQGKLL